LLSLPLLLIDRCCDSNRAGGRVAGVLRIQLQSSYSLKQEEKTSSWFLVLWKERGMYAFLGRRQCVASAG
jgi:hypothetical protein